MHGVNATTLRITMWQRSQQLLQLQTENSEISNLQRTTLHTRNKEMDNWLYVSSFLSPLNHTDAHSFFQSPSHVNMKMYVSLVHSIAL